MSYRNPTQHIDRQSGHIEQNLQKTLAGIGTGVVSSINKIHADNAAKTAAIRAEADKRVADAQNSIMQTQSKNPTANVEEAELFIKEIRVDSSGMLKRLRPAPQGRAHRIRKRSNHVTLILGSQNSIES